jgi:undecaprenyl-diphosphatase
MIEVLKQFVLGMVQGLSEFLPISSSGHIKLFQHLFGYQGEDNLFVSIMLHLGTLVAVLIVYHKLIWDMVKEAFLSVRDICKGQFSFKEMNQTRRMLVMILLSTILLGFMIIPLGENSLKDYIEMLNTCESLIPLGIAFLVTGFVLILSFRITAKQKSPRQNATVKDALIIGGAQCVATISGISRSGSTMATGLLCGLSREYMVKYSFIMSIPAILAAAASDASEVISGEVILSVDVLPLIVGVLSAMIFGVLSIKMIEWLIRKDRYNLFGYYCFALGVTVLVLGIVGI